MNLLLLNLTSEEQTKDITNGLKNILTQVNKWYFLAGWSVLLIAMACFTSIKKSLLFTGKLCNPTVTSVLSFRRCQFTNKVQQWRCDLRNTWCCNNRYLRDKQYNCKKDRRKTNKYFLLWNTEIPTLYPSWVCWPTTASKNIYHTEKLFLGKANKQRGWKCMGRKTWDLLTNIATVLGFQNTVIEGKSQLSIDLSLVLNRQVYHPKPNGLAITASGMCALFVPVSQVWLPGCRARLGRTELVVLEKALVKQARGLNQGCPSLPQELLLSGGCPAVPCPSHSPDVSQLSVHGHSPGWCPHGAPACPIP